MNRLLTAVLLPLLLALAIPAMALESAPVLSKRATVTLVSDTDRVSAGASFRAGLRFRLAEGWHTYWRNPGDAGIPPELQLEVKPGGRVGPIEWPTPRRIAEGSVMSYSYSGEVLLPVTVTLEQGAAAATLTAHANWLVCKDICVPEEGDFRLDLPAGGMGPSPQAPLFAAHDRQMPRMSPWKATISSDGALSVWGPELNTSMVADAWFIPDRPSLIQDDATQLLSIRTGGFVLSLKPRTASSLTGGLSGILSVLDRSGLQADVSVSAPPGPPPPPVVPPLGQVLTFAFLGGLILNLMPCVFPILAMKAVGFAAGAARGKAHAHALSYTVGVLTTFAALSGSLLAARSAGAAIGWGFQFASPVFVAGLSWLMFAVGLNMSGVFQVGTSLTNIGGRLADRHGHVGSFFTGLLAVLVATPCTAPFMGVAIAAGLAAPAPVTILVFLVMGLGLASPYIALACLPGLARRIPRPGRWMELLKQGLAFPMYGAAVWLLWVVSQEVGSPGVLATAAGFVLLGFAGWVLGVGQTSTGRNRRIAGSAAVAAVAGAVVVLSGIALAPSSPAVETGSASEPYSAQRLTELREQGRPVFVNMTAAWCITCQVNERVAISGELVRREFSLRHVAYLKGDWTRQNPEITTYLRQNGREGVPLYVFYPAGDGMPVTLPQILTEAQVLQVLGTG